jgi:regulator of sirC expression with transglutaminase-like and TPR domain
MTDECADLMERTTESNPALPQCCKPAAFKLLTRQAQNINSDQALLMGAIAISMQQLDDVSPAGVDGTLSRYAQTVQSRVRGPQPQALLAHLHEVLFEEEGYAGNADDYYNPSNSYLPTVLQTKRGLPITLSLLYKNVADRLGLRTAASASPAISLSRSICPAANPCSSTPTPADACSRWMRPTNA